MAGRAPSPNDFDEILNRGAKVDEIFKDQAVPRGSDPFDLRKAEEVDQPSEGLALSISPPSQENLDLNEADSNLGQGSLSDNDGLFFINRKFAALESIFKLVTRDQMSFGQLISEILRVAMEQVKSDAGSFLEIDYQNNCMFFRAAAGRASEGLLNFTVPLGQGIAGFVCETQQPLALSNIDDSRVYLRSISDAVGFETKNMIAVPVVIRGVTFGCLELLNRLGETQYTEADKEVLSAICEFGAKVIENRLLLSAISKELAALKTLKSNEEAA